jgi:hypothetical protein
MPCLCIVEGFNINFIWFSRPLLITSSHAYPIIWLIYCIILYWCAPIWMMPTHINNLNSVDNNGMTKRRYIFFLYFELIGAGDLKLYYNKTFTSFVITGNELITEILYIPDMWLDRIEFKMQNTLFIHFTKKCLIKGYIRSNRKNKK